MWSNQLHPYVCSEPIALWYRYIGHYHLHYKFYLNVALLLTIFRSHTVNWLVLFYGLDNLGMFLNNTILTKLLYADEFEVGFAISKFRKKTWNPKKYDFSK